MAKSNPFVKEPRPDGLSEVVQLRLAPKMKNWLNDHGCRIPNLQAGTVEMYLRSTTVPEKCKDPVR